jgi:transglutaminase-like putative cysteine protease
MEVAWTVCRRAAVQTTLALAAVLVPGWGQAQMLASIPVELAPGFDHSSATAGSASLRVRVHAADSAGLARFLGEPEGGDASAGYLDLTLAPGMHPDVGTSVDVVTPSFIVDFDDPAVARLGRQLADEQGRAPIGGTDIVAFVAKSMRAEFAVNASLASEVARSLRGDCTEHSLLTAALARSRQIPARIVHGAALLYAEGRWQTYGHAWVQMREAGHWVVRDSALAHFPGPVYYLPAIVVVEEGPGYKIGMLQGYGRLPSRIEILEGISAKSVK